MALIGAVAGAALAGVILGLAGTQSSWGATQQWTSVLSGTLPLAGLVGGGLLGLIGEDKKGTGTFMGKKGTGRWQSASWTW